MSEIQRKEVLSMSDHANEHRERHDAEATTLSGASQDGESDKRVPEGARETVEKAASEGGEGDGVVDAVKRVGREVDRTFSGEYEAREDQAAAKRADENASG